MAALPVWMTPILSSCCLRRASHLCKPKHSAIPHPNFPCLSEGMDCIHDVEWMISAAITSVLRQVQIVQGEGGCVMFCSFTFQR